ncbi:hypothetical protein EGW08_010852 [Elysia chlorotica]|uniref:Uncharacterized protein n=1 Tax=Elysia chlorotica TaxID=188477 RepID=A0A3S1HKH4_ELYCH|nr:hypothetical protein EGW08_010852 [Elysia chlorotica]
MRTRGRTSSSGRAGGRASNHLASSREGKGPGLFGPGRTNFLEMATLVFMLVYLLMCVTVTSERTKTPEEEDRAVPYPSVATRYSDLTLSPSLSVRKASTILNKECAYSFVFIVVVVGGGANSGAGVGVGGGCGVSGGVVVVVNLPVYVHCLEARKKFWSIADQDGQRNSHSRLICSQLKRGCLRKFPRRNQYGDGNTWRGILGDLVHHMIVSFAGLLLGLAPMRAGPTGPLIDEALGTPDFDRAAKQGVTKKMILQAS